MECPVCSMVLPDGTKLCPGCKADLSKWRPKKEAGNSASEPAVILEQREVFTLSSLVKPLLPYTRLFGALLIFCALLYGGYKAYMAYLLRTELAYIAELGAAAETPVPAAAPGIQLSTAGFTTLYQEYSAQAAALGAAPLEKEAGDFFQSGAAELEAVSAAAVEGAGLAAAEEYMEKTFGGPADEQEKAAMETLVREFNGKKRKPMEGDAAALLETYKVRFRREGALAALERLRRQAPPPAEERQPQDR